MTKAICILLAEGFEESEAVVPADLLKRLGVNIIFTSITNNKDVRGAHGFKFIADTTINNISTKNINKKLVFYLTFRFLYDILLSVDILSLTVFLWWGYGFTISCKIKGAYNV